MSKEKKKAIRHDKKERKIRWDLFRKYFKFTPGRAAAAVIILACLFTIQGIFTGSLLSRQSITTKPGDSASAVIGILEDTEVVRQKFTFNKDVTLNAFALSFGSFKRKKTADYMDIQLIDSEANIVFEKSISTDNVSPNTSYNIKLVNAIKIPAGVTCTIRIAGFADRDMITYATLPTLNTTNKTDPNTYMSTLNFQTKKKSLNISYSYTYGLVYPFFVMIFEVLAILFLIFENVSERIIPARSAYEQEIAAIRKSDPKPAFDDSSVIKHRTRKAKYHKSHAFKSFLVSRRNIYTIRNIFIIINPLVLMLILETLNGNLGLVKPNVWPFSWLLVLSIEFIFIALTGNSLAGVAAADILLFILGLVNFFVLTFRGTPFIPSDILGTNTAAEVVSTYSFSFTPAQYIMLVLFVIWIMVLLKCRKRKRKFNIRRYVSVLVTCLAPAIIILAVFYNTPLLTNAGVTDDIWNKAQSCRKNGFYMNFFLNIHYLKVSKPSGYSLDKAKNIMDKVYDGSYISTAGAIRQVPLSDGSENMKTNADFEMNDKLNGKKPNIILIMNESLADFDLAGRMSYSEDPLPYIHSMGKNTIKGRDYVSVFGAGTSNSEFEAMTGNTMTFFPSGSNVYQQFTHDTTFALAYYLKTLGYSTTAVHPSSPTNWNRTNAYRSQHFDRFVSIDEFKNPTYIRYISDKDSYKKVIELYEAAKDDKPMFFFDMTIQNHGGYTTKTDWKDPVKVSNSYYNETDEYLSSIHVSDQAFKYLIDYFSKVDDPTLIVMFGDHFPAVETAFYEQLLGKGEADWELDDMQKRYGVPYIMWANYDIQEADNLVISNNYNENMILKQAGIPLPAYNQFIEDVSAYIPAMNVNGYMDSDGHWHDYKDIKDKTLSDLISDYKILQYAYYSDKNKEEAAEIFRMDAGLKDKGLTLQKN
ncbi:MAG: sulfatase-like hydrolase/transferase [Lachnospiraceae bacterium]|jgi:phosphoglycerol transferase MdoB-like AlkP superfamily enzyme|nr:sulfatase-like hydrolase/transferase [Lachnospiraceae bacterium]MEE3460720.1 sulfatase-like hydrolase/transferase [Lachnospiraceae bacterium]